MNSKFLRHCACVFLALGTASSVQALPNIDKPAAMKDLSDMSKGFDVLMRGDGSEDDMNVVYFPYKRLRVVKNQNGDPTFSFAYSQEGGYMSATLAADADLVSLQEQFERVKAGDPNGDNLRIAPLPVRAGTYRPSLSSKSGGDFIIGATEIEQAIPTNEVAVSMLLGKKEADLIVLGMQGGAGIGWNYTYAFPAKITPYRATISLHWSSINNQARTQFGGTVDAGWFAGSVQIDRFTRSLIENKSIEIQINGGDGFDALEAATMDIVKIVVARVFKANHPDSKFPDLKLPPPKSAPTFFGIPMGVAVSAAYSYASMKSEEQIDETIVLTSSPTKIFNATAGVNIGGYCNTHPQLFAYQGATPNPDGTFPILKGCPDRILPKKGDPLPPAGVPKAAPYVPSKTDVPPPLPPENSTCKLPGFCG